jgi:hypothetical protein
MTAARLVGVHVAQRIRLASSDDRFALRHTSYRDAGRWLLATGCAPASQLPRQAAAR